MDNCSLVSQDVNSDCSFADLLFRRPSVSDKAVTTALVEKPKLKTTRKSWSKKESELLTVLIRQGKSSAFAAKELGRTLCAVDGQIRKLNIQRCKGLTIKQEQFLRDNYWILGSAGCAKKLNRNQATIAYYAKYLGLKKPTRDDVNPPIPRCLLPYDMVKRVSVLQRKSPTSKNKVDDAVVIFYDKNGPSTPMMAMHLDQLCSALDQHFNRRPGVTAQALTHGYKAV
ncbi:gcrA cell cycle regulator family protein [Vibrio scophthalmi]|uniref:gcrA cell cycle regulator family protein n=1 Tax=Vibrio scophthalmi TaxID=45658 RepID=UPI003EBF1401